jgi:hypothetical protein
MSLAVNWEFECDFGGCEASLLVDGCASATSAREVATEAGWGRWSAGEKGDYCPQHKNLYTKANWQRVST